MAHSIIVIPCFDEAARLSGEAFVDFVQKTEGVDLLFVNDGSRDGTLEVLRALEARRPDRISVLDQQPNRGKAEAVRAGLNAALERGADFAGYFDADLATPLDQIPRLIAVLEELPAIEVVFGARVQLMGRKIQRNKLRHYLGRVFATVASESLGLPIYDTQCGAKLFRLSPELAPLFAEPFVASWIFDVEILARLIDSRRGSELPRAAEVIYELPLDEWVDVGGSKVRAGDFVKSVFEMWAIYRRYLSRSARSRGRG